MNAGPEGAPGPAGGAAPVHWPELWHGSDRPIRLMLLSGEQILPNLQSVLACMESGRLAAVHIACTSHGARSIRPAEGLKAVVESLVPEDFGAARALRVEICAGLDGVDPAAINAWASGLVRHYPRAEWVCNLTGALKPMSFGLRDFIRDANRADVRGLYLERALGWALVTCTDGVYRRQPMDPPTRDELIDKMPLKALVTAAAVSGEFEVQIGALPALRTSFMDVTQQLIDSRWAWTKVFVRCGFSAIQSQGGLPLEIWLAHLLKALGVTRVAWSLKLVSGGTVIAESDVVCCHRGRIVLFDLKLSSTKSVGAPYNQIRSASKTAAMLGGLSARAVLVRPAWVDDPAKRAFAAALQANVLDAAGCRRIAQQLAELLGLDERARQFAAQLDARIVRSVAAKSKVLLPPPEPKLKRKARQYRKQGGPAK